MLEINLLDVLVAVILLIFLARGLLRGLIREVGGLVGIMAGFALARHFQASVQPALEQLFSNTKVAGVLSFLLIFALTFVAVALLIFALHKFMTITLTVWIDHFLGALAGLAKGLLLMTLVFFLLQEFFPGIALVENAQATPLFDSLRDYLRGFLPEAFTFKLPVRL